MENVNARPCTVTRQGHSVSCESCKIFYGKKGSLCVRHLWFAQNQCAKLTQIRAQGIFKFCQN